VPVEIAIAQPKLWSPESPFLYDLKVTIQEDGKVLDSVASYFGMRSVKVAKDDKGVNRLMLNGKFVFQVGTLDQGFWPDGLYTAPTDEALRWTSRPTRSWASTCAQAREGRAAPLVLLVRQAGPLGLADMPSGRAGDNKTDKRRNEAAATQFERELRALIDTHASSPAIIMWVVFNEGWGNTTRRASPTG